MDPAALLDATDPGAPPRRVRDRADLEATADVIVALGEAPDGRPLLLDVRRGAAVGAVLDAHLGAPATMPPVVAASIAGLEAVLEQAARAAGLAALGGARLYRSGATVGALLGPTLLARALGAHSPLPADPADPADPAAPVGTGAVASTSLAAAAPVTVMRTPTAGQRHVAVPLRGGPALLVDGTADLGPEHVAPLRFEALRPLPSARYRVRGAAPADGPLADEVGYARALAALRPAPGATGPWIEWSVDATDVGRAIARLARSIAALHDEGRVHADVKPANSVLVDLGGGRPGAVAIDPIGVVAGQPSPGATPGSAAPEQVLSRPVLPASDVYPLGLMIARLLGAVLCGEERTFLVAVGGGRGRRLRLLSEPDVVLPTSLELPPAVRVGWEALVRSAVEFDADDRLASALGLADRVEELLDAAPLPHRLTIGPGPGALVRDVDLGDGAAAAWLVRDHRGPLG